MPAGLERELIVLGCDELWPGNPKTGSEAWIWNRDIQETITKKLQDSAMLEQEETDIK